jgi:hypothetical protein
VSLFDREDHRPTVVRELPPLPLIITPGRWKDHFETHFRKIKKAQERYDTARLCRLDFAAEELGAFAFQCEREFVPLRWMVRRRKDCPVLRLIDDSGEAEAPEVLHFTFERPAVGKRLESGPVFAVSAPGGLYVAQQRDFTAAVIALPTIRNFADLRWSVHIGVRERSPNSVIHAIELGHLWGAAKSSGDILSVRNRLTVLNAITHQILLLIGGDRWGTAEREFESGGDLDVLQQAVSKRPEELGIAAALAHETVQLAAATLETRIRRLAELAASSRLLAPGWLGGTVPDSPSWIAEFALRLASSPKDAATWGGSHLRTGVTRLMEAPTLARAARFLVIATDRHLQSRAAPGELYASWSWA